MPKEITSFDDASATFECKMLAEDLDGEKVYCKAHVNPAQWPRVVASKRPIISLSLSLSVVKIGVTSTTSASAVMLSVTIKPVVSAMHVFQVGSVVMRLSSSRPSVVYIHASSEACSLTSFSLSLYLSLAFSLQHTFRSSNGTSCILSQAMSGLGYAPQSGIGIKKNLLGINKKLIRHQQKTY